MALTAPASALVLTVCSASCLLAMEDDCDCRCCGRFHGLLAQVPVVVDPDVRVPVALATDEEADEDAAAAVRMRAAGVSYSVIGARLGRSKTWAYYAVNPREVDPANGSAN